MGRFLSAFRSPEPCNSAPVADEHQDTEASFIEVGGPAGAMEASPDVLAAEAPASIPPTLEASELIVLDETPLESAIKLRLFNPKGAHAASVPWPSQRLVAYHAPHGLQAEHYAAIANEIVSSVSGRKGIAVLFAEEPGVTDGLLTFLNLAICMARRTAHSIVAVEAASSRESMALLFGLDSIPGLAEVLSGAGSLRASVQPSGIEQLQLLTAGLDQMPRHLLASASMKSTIRHLEKENDLALIYGGCWDGAPALVSLAHNCDSAFLMHSSESPAELLKVMMVQGAPIRGTLHLRHAA